MSSRAPSRPPGDWRVNADPEMVRRMNAVAELLRREAPPGWGFALLFFTFGTGGQMIWISNADRQDMLAALQEFIQAQGS